MTGTVGLPRARPPEGTPPTVHPTAVVEPGASLGAGVAIWHFCHVRAGARLGAGVVLGQGCHVGPGVVVGDGCRIQNGVQLFEGVELEEDVFVGPHVTFTNVRRPRAAVSRRARFEPIRVGRGASLGAASVVLPGVSVGAHAMVGAGAVVTGDVPAHALVVGAPARRVGWVGVGGERLVLVASRWRCPETAREYEEVGGELREVTE